MSTHEHSWEICTCGAMREPEGAAPQAEGLICAACGQTDPPVVEVPLHPRCASSAPQALDVERLAEALNATVGKYGWARSAPADPVAEWRVNAHRVAAEYARLASEPTETGETDG